MTGAPTIAAELEVSQERIDAWAEVSDDANPLHVDQTYAGSTRFGGTIAHGHLLMAFTLDLMHAAAGPAWLEGGELREARFRAPVRAGTTVRCEAVPLESGPGAPAAWRVELSDVGTGTICLAAEARLAGRGPGAAPG
jgi:3-hydroxybutyryl-CoA dehydratase